jgi:hypothetical protein
VRLFSYKMTNDSGFAPNPFFGVLTMATCKPGMRKSKRRGDWIAGFTSKKLCGDEIGEERLVYLMQVTGKIPISDYFSHPDFQKKIPDLSHDVFVHKAGDNIYKPHVDGFTQLENKNHTDEHVGHDLSGEYVLISTRFYYFGRESLAFGNGPQQIPRDLRPKIPTNQTAQGDLTHDSERAEKFINFVTSRYEVGVHSAPHKWPRDDISWKAQ